MDLKTHSLYRLLPGVNSVLERPGMRSLLEAHRQEAVTEAVKATLEELRQGIQRGDLDEAALAGAVGAIEGHVESRLQRSLRPRLQRVVNATGVLLQTNLGRAPLSEAALRHIGEVARGYCNLEFDLEAGVRGARDLLAEDLVLQVALGPAHAPDHGKAAAVVNNCAAATFLALNTMAEGGEVIVSRGELVEIGGGFRVPEILAKSGAVLREVGTTNKTHLRDYAAAINPQTRLILRVHRSNFKIEGFTSQPTLAELAELGRRASLPVFDDQGTGCVIDLAEVGIMGESSWRESVASGVSMVAASGDKLLGGPQCGLLVGDRAPIEKMRGNPLFRAMRADKLSYAALESTLLAYLTGREDELPLLAMLRVPAEELRLRCERMAARLREGGTLFEVDVVPTRSLVGGGTTPGASLSSFAVALRPLRESEGELAKRLRLLDPPVVTRVSSGVVLLDLRTVAPADDAVLVQGMRWLEVQP